VGEEPDRIRAEIEETRAEMSETVDALGYKADVKTRAKENLQEKRDSAKESIMGVKDKVVGGTPDSGDVKHQARQAKSVAQENPLGLAIGSGQEALEHGKQVAQDAAQSAQQTAKESGQEHAQQVKETAQHQAQDARSQQTPSYQTH
jgi:hypothetical protein